MVFWELLEDQHRHQMTFIQKIKKIKKIDCGVNQGQPLG